MEPKTVMDLAGNLGTVAVLVWLIVYMFKTVLPAQQAEFAKLIKDLRESSSADVAKVAASVDALTSKTEELANLVLLHDATVRGINPQVLGTTHDLAKQAGMPHEMVDSAVRQAVKREQKRYKPTKDPRSTQELVALVSAAVARELAGASD